MTRFLPRFGILRSSTVGLGDVDDPRADDFDGPVLVIQWGPFVLEIMIGRRSA